MTTLYAKVMHGKRTSYEPVAETVLWDSFPKGAHLIVVEPGVLSCRYSVNPATVALLAALHLRRDDVLTAMREASAQRPASRKLTKREQKALAAFYEIAGPEARFTMTIPAAASVLDALEAALIKAI